MPFNVDKYFVRLKKCFNINRSDGPLHRDFQRMLRERRIQLRPELANTGQALRFVMQGYEQNMKTNVKTHFRRHVRKFFLRTLIAVDDWAEFHERYDETDAEQRLNANERKQIINDAMTYLIDPESRIQVHDRPDVFRLLEEYRRVLRPLLLPTVALETDAFGVHMPRGWLAGTHNDNDWYV